MGRELVELLGVDDIGEKFERRGVLLAELEDRVHRALNLVAVTVRRRGKANRDRKRSRGDAIDQELIGLDLEVVAVAAVGDGAEEPDDLLVDERRLAEVRDEGR